MNNPDEKVALQAIEFWSTVCDEEIELKEEALEVNRLVAYIRMLKTHYLLHIYIGC